MALSYQAKHRAKKWLKAGAVLLGAVLVFCAGRFIYLQRYLVYDADGVHLDYGGQPTYGAAEKDSKHDEEYILRQEGTVSALGGSRGKYKTFSGYYVTASQLLDPAHHKEILSAVDGANAVMLDMKTSVGKFLWDTSLPGTQTANTDTEAVKALVKELAGRGGVTLTARIPAFRDSAKALELRNQALPIKGGALWLDENGSYWLDPAGNDVADYLIAQARELEALGFDEIVFTDFHFPTSSNIRYGDKDGIGGVRDCAKAIKARLDVLEIPMSFLSNDDEITALSHRFYTVAENGNQVKPLATKFADLTKGEDGQLVFLTGSRDTRFNAYSKLQPIELD